MSIPHKGSGLLFPAPSGCRWCGVDEREHMQRWKLPVGWHKWEAPTLEQRKERMIARRRSAAGSQEAGPAGAATRLAS
jgi:hypothetical protein